MMIIWSIPDVMEDPDKETNQSFLQLFPIIPKKPG